MPLSQNFETAFTDFLEGHSEHFTNEMQTAQRLILCDWKDRFRLMVDLLGFSGQEGMSGSPGDPLSSVIVRVLPNFHPEYQWLWCIDCQVQPRALSTPNQGGLAQDFINYVDPGTKSSCMILATYANRDYLIRSDLDVHSLAVPELNRYVSRFESLSTESVTVQGHTFMYVDAVAVNREPIKEPGSKHSGILTVRHQWHQVPRVPKANILLRVGQTNSAVFDDRLAAVVSGIFYEAEVGYAAETLLFVGADWKETHGLGALRQFEIEYTWLWRGGTVGATTASWNKLYRKTAPGGAISPGFYAISSDGLTTGVKLYTLGDMTKLYDLA